jgi:branched-chain amino acid transport system ATP-binding protein
MPWFRRLGGGVRHPVRWIEELTGDGPALALFVLFGLNAVDELARTAFAVAAPTIADEFGVGLAGVTVPFVLAFSAALGLSIPIASLADRGHRVRLALLGGVIFAVFSTLIGLSVSIWMVAVALAGSQVGKAFIEPSHTSLLADYYEVGLRPRIFSFYRAGNAVGALLGGICAGYVAEAFSWRAPFLLFAVPTAILVLAGGTLREPKRGVQEKKLAGASTDTAETEEESPSLAEAWRMCWRIDSLRRIYRTLPFLTPAVAGFGIFSSFMYRDVFGLGEAGRGWVVGLVEGPSQLAGLVVGAYLGMKLFAKDPKLVFGLLSKSIFVVTGAVLVFAWSPNVYLAVIAHVVISACLAFVLPGLFAALSLAIPPRARSTGFAMGSLFVLAGMAAIPVISVVAGAWGMRWGLTVMGPVFLVGGLVIASAGDLITRDIVQVWSAAAARSESLAARRAGRAKMLLVRGLEVSYGDVQVLFDVDFEVDQGEIVALLGTNGAGKSTLLKAICGLVPASKGAVIFDGRDITYAPPHEIAPRGVVLVPGGQSVFPSLTVAENLRAAGWIDRRAKTQAAERVEEVLSTFPILRDLLNDPAANLSGGQQQMLGLGMAFLSRPQLVMIDELALGLAPAVVEQLVGIVRRLRDQGTTVIVVEQSVNVALTLAEEAYFMEKGEIRFHGPTAELLDRPDILRSVFLAGATAATSPNGSDASGPDADDSNASGPDADDSNASGPVADDSNASGPVADDSDADGPAVVVTAVRDPEPASVATAGAAAPAALELVGVTRSFGGIRAVDDVSLSVAYGEVVGIIGPNGAGKTTLFDLISGFAPLQAGRVLLDGHDVSHLHPAARSRLGLGRSFQDARLFPALTVEQCIGVALDRWVDVRDPIQAALSLPASFDSEEAVDARVDELVELLGLGGFRTTFVHELSTGSRRIVELACLVAHQPKVILLDEPSSGIAQREAEALGPVLLRLREQLGASLIVIEHDMPLITAVSDRMAALELGRKVTEGTPDEVLHHPQVVASYLGTDAAVIQRSGARAAV